MDSGNVLDLQPLIQRKRAKDCLHQVVSVDDNIMSLTCDGCGSEIDPWWYLRKLANEPARWQEYTAKQQEIVRKLDAEIARQRVVIGKYAAEITDLVDTKNRLANEQFEGRPLGNYVRRRRRAPVTTTG